MDLESTRRLCPVCGQPLTYLLEHRQWYCYNCKKFDTKREMAFPSIGSIAMIFVGLLSLGIGGIIGINCLERLQYGRFNESDIIYLIYSLLLLVPGFVSFVDGISISKQGSYRDISSKTSVYAGSLQDKMKYIRGNRKRLALRTALYFAILTIIFIPGYFLISPKATSGKEALLFSICTVLPAFMMIMGLPYFCLEWYTLKKTLKHQIF